jgi:transketolase
MAIFRGMPNLTIVDPCDSIDIEQAVPQLAASEGPTYLRLLRGNVPTVLDEYDYTFELGKAKVLRGGNDVVFISSGLMTMRALQTAKALAAHNVDVAVVHTPTIKPFDAETVLAEINTDRLAVTLENHSVVGGLFETVASAVVSAGVGKRVVPVALPDQFLDAGALPTLHDRYGLATDRIVAKVLAELG